MFGYRIRLARLWAAWSGVLFLFIAYRSLIGGYGVATQHVWQWFLPNVMPTLALILTIETFDRDAAPTKSMDAGAAYQFACGSSIVYLLLLSAPIFIEPMRDGDPMPLLSQSNLWLAPLQGLTTSALGLFFVRNRAADRTPPDSA